MVLAHKEIVYQKSLISIAREGRQEEAFFTSTEIYFPTLFFTWYSVCNAVSPHRVSGDSSVVTESRTRDRKVPGPSPGRSGGRIFFSRVNFLC